MRARPRRHPRDRTCRSNRVLLFLRLCFGFLTLAISEGLCTTLETVQYGIWIMSGTTANVCFYGIRTIQGCDVDSCLTLNLPLDTSIEVLLEILATKYAFKPPDGLKRHGRPSKIDTTTLASQTVAVVGGSYHGPSKTGLTINEDETLISFHNKVHCTKELTSNLGKSRLTSTELCVDNGNLRVQFRRTIRVPDDGQTHMLPPGLGKFSIYHVANYAANLPLEIVQKGGVFIPMYQREAMWILFRASRPFVIKVYVGGVNGISGEPMVPNMTTHLERTSGVLRKQNYVIVPPQLWLDGIATRPGLVKQFVAMPYGSGYSVEQQVSGVEQTSGLQFEIIPMYDQNVSFCRERRCDPAKPSWDILSTPRDLGMQPGQDLYMRQTNKMVKRPTILRDLLRRGSSVLSDILKLDLYQIFNGRLEISIPELASTINLRVDSSIAFEEIANMIATKTSLSIEGRRLAIGNNIIRSWQDLERHAANFEMSPQTHTRLQFRSVCGIITIKALMGQTIAVYYDGSGTVGDLKSKVEAEVGASPAQQRLIYCGRQIEDAETLESHKICVGSVIHLVLKPRDQCTGVRASSADYTPAYRINIRTLTGKVTPICCDSSYTIAIIKSLIRDKEGIPPNKQGLIFEGQQLQDMITLRNYNIPHGATIDLVLQLGGGGVLPEEGHMMSRAAGGTIKLSIAEDKHDPRVWNLDKGKLVNVQIVNPVRFEDITGMAMPSTPISFETYVSMGLPFFDIYNESLGIVTGSFSEVQTVSEKDASFGAREHTVYNSAVPPICTVCHTRIRDCIIRPCDHCLCRLCAESIINSEHPRCGTCPTCYTLISRILGISGPMNAPGNEAVSYALPVVMLDVVDRREKFRSIVTRPEVY